VVEGTLERREPLFGRATELLSHQGEIYAFRGDRPTPLRLRLKGGFSAEPLRIRTGELVVLLVLLWIVKYRNAGALRARRM